MAFLGILGFSLFLTIIVLIITSIITYSLITMIKEIKFIQISLWNLFIILLSQFFLISLFHSPKESPLGSAIFQTAIFFSFMFYLAIPISYIIYCSNKINKTS